ncbi:Ser-Thr-rich glycosyl-phosphatidyl-inositol-anchored membrane family-domain-containing protein [Aspergillus pseudonomiae]|uniref:Ser-Thr-rich glycosyl-phosphatidyl-inositol-anchored membrane family-domain-containing protein n=1 Tax=Aspergillus pseudonomiae TaxID=1506151 RepID=A0A5N7DRX4_9EURO|nr:Ser-Thr-rich glycosyl-phosphatidyl-inositol-anchored membrane family-domain-containing protein [Aspergillus pseudonomiae]KAE8408783.1 Ser-Thr-rich glycosyl-phosphatidyl-inositol-anchored membrane family-domain-containing protein [Aspergillus pseudonomiae]
MRSIFYLTLSAMASLAAAATGANPFNIPAEGYSFEAGEPTTLTWKPTTEGTVSLKLQWGAVMTANTGTTIAKNIANSGSFTWTPPANLAAQPDYTIEIFNDDDTSEVNYLPRFTVAGATAAPSTTASATTTAETTSATDPLAPLPAPPAPRLALPRPPLRPPALPPPVPRPRPPPLPASMAVWLTASPAACWRSFWVPLPCCEPPTDSSRRSDHTLLIR